MRRYVWLPPNVVDRLKATRAGRETTTAELKTDTIKI
jgi:hypothetical protein